jgi:hypothetical protein
MALPSTSTPLPRPLHCLGGAAAPGEIAADLERLGAFPRSAQENLWDALGPCLGEVVPADAEEGLDRFCKTHGASPEDLAVVLKALRFLLREAAARDLSRAVFAEDLASLVGPEGAALALVLPRYEAAKKVIRGEALQRALLEHGKLLERVDYRVDYMVSSNRGEKLNVPITLLTLTVREGERRERTTVQVLPEQLRALRALCDKLLA